MNLKKKMISNLTSLKLLNTFQQHFTKYKKENDTIKTWYHNQKLQGWDFLLVGLKTGNI